jgi:hypothetical protein
MSLTVVVLAVTLGSAAPTQATPPAGETTPNTVRLAEGSPRPPARIADVAWLSGAWQGEGLGGSAEETWSKPAGGSMVGYFRLVRDGKPVFYEIMTLLEVEGSLELRLKHVNPDMTGWEEKGDFVTFKLARLDTDAVYFSGLTFRRAGPDRLEIYLALRDRTNNAVREEKFTMTRVRER